MPLIIILTVILLVVYGIIGGCLGFFVTGIGSFSIDAALVGAVKGMEAAFLLVSVWLIAVALFGEFLPLRRRS